MLVLVPKNASVNPWSLSVKCTLGLSREVVMLGEVLTSQFPETSETRYAVLCMMPAYADLPGSLHNVNLSVPLNATTDGVNFLLPHSSQLVYFSISEVYPSFGLSKGGTKVTVQGTNLQHPDMAPACSFHFVPLVEYNMSAPWSEATLFQGSSRTFQTEAVAASDKGLVCDQPPLPPHLFGDFALSVSPDRPSKPFSRDVSFSLSDPTIAGVTIARSTVVGNFLVTILGQGFSTGQGSVPETPLCRFGAAHVTGSILSDSAIKCNVPGRTTAEILLVEVSLNGQAYLSGEAVFNYFLQTSLSSVSPSTFPHNGGAVVTVFGSHFQFDTAQHGASCRCHGPPYPHFLKEPMGICEMDSKDMWRLPALPREASCAGLSDGALVKWAPDATTCFAGSQ